MSWGPMGSIYIWYLSRKLSRILIVERVDPLRVFSVCGIVGRIEYVCDRSFQPTFADELCSCAHCSLRNASFVSHSMAPVVAAAAFVHNSIAIFVMAIFCSAQSAPIHSQRQLLNNKFINYLREHFAARTCVDDVNERAANTRHPAHAHRVESLFSKCGAISLFN